MLFGGMHRVKGRIQDLIENVIGGGNQACRNQGKNRQRNVTPLDLKIQNQRDGYDMPKKNEDVL